MSEKRKIVAIDGNSLLYRAFYAMKPLSTSEGVPTNAVYGFTLMLQKILQDEKPDAVVVAFDAPVKTFRHEEFEDYKAQRKPTPDDLRAQAPIARRLVEAFGIPILEVPGYEADDVVGTVARMASSSGYDTLIVTGDLDTLQLIDDKVKVMATVKGVTDVVLYDRDAVLERFGVEPSQLVDYKALKGDPSDNIPGVAGVGDKTAAKLVSQFGSVEEMLSNISKIEDPKLREKIESSADLVKMSKRLATIVTDVPLEVNIEDLETRPPDYDKLRQLFTELEFRSMLKKLPEETGSIPSESAEPAGFGYGECRIAGSSADIDRLLDEINRSGIFSIRVHTTGGKPAESDLVGIAFSIGSGGTYVRVRNANGDQKQNGILAFGEDDEPFAVDIGVFKQVLENPNVRKVGHDIKLDIESLALNGIRIKGIDFDTMIGAYVLDPGRGSYSIEEIALQRIGLDMASLAVDNSVEKRFCAEAEVIFRLVPILKDALQRDDLFELTERVEIPLVPVLADIELQGIAVDKEWLAVLSERLNSAIEQLEHKIYAEAGHEFNIGSTKQLQTVLFEQMQIPSGKKTKTGFSTSAEILEELAPAYPIVEYILQWRELTKLRSTYVESLPKLINPRTGRIHTSLNQAVTSTGRLSSSDPNLQNIPVRTDIGREIRKAFVASGDNLLLSADYSQIELRILAHVTGDPELVRAFENGEDIHAHTASTLFGVDESQVTPEMRRSAKTVNFAVIYGMTDYGLARALGISSHEAKEFIDKYFQKFPGVRRFTEETIEQARRNGFVTTPIMGRRRYIRDINSSNRNARAFAERAAVNMPIQGAAADVIKIAMIDIHRAVEDRKLAAKMVLQVHDELVFEVPKDDVQNSALIVKRLMEDACKLSVPVVVDVKSGVNWAEMTPVS